MVKRMLKIGKKTGTCNVNQRNKFGNDSFKRALDIFRQDREASCPADQRNLTFKQSDWNQTNDDPMYQIVAEQKRALALMYASRNTFR